MFGWAKRRKNEGEVRATLYPDYSVGEIARFISAIAQGHHVCEAYLMVPNLDGISTYRPNSVNLVYVLGEGSTFKDLHEFQDEIYSVFREQVRPYASGPNDRMYHSAIKEGLRIV